MKKRIIFKLREFPHVSETFIIAQIITALKLGYDINVLTTRLLDIKGSAHEKLLNQHQIPDKIIIENYDIPKNKFIRLVKWLILLISNFKNINYIIKFYKENTKFSLTWLYQWVFYKQFHNATMFHVQYGTNKNPLDVLKKTGYLKPALIVCFHGHDAFFPINGFIPNNGYYDALFKYANLIIANTPYLANQLLALGVPKEKLTIIPVGVDTDYFCANKKKGKDTNTFKLITIGRLSVVKGHIYALEVIKKLKEADCHVRFTLVGEGTEKDALENYIKDNNLEDYVFLVGGKSSNEIIELLSASDIFIFTSVPEYHGHSTETQGLATLEAMACQLPVVAFDTGGVKYTFEDEVSGFVCDEYDTDCVFNKVRYLIENRTILKDMGEAARAFVIQNYSQKEIDKKWKIIYGNLSNG